MFGNSVRVVALAAIAMSAAACVSPGGDTRDQKWQSAHAMRDEYLQIARSDEPGLEAALAAAPGYLVMDTFVLKILIIGTANGYGVLVDNRDHTETIVDHRTLAIGPGVEVARVGGVIVFHDAAALDAFKEGLTEFGAEAAAALKFGDFGGSVRGNTTGSSTTNHELFVGGVALHASIFWAFISRDEELGSSQ